VAPSSEQVPLVTWCGRGAVSRSRDPREINTTRRPHVAVASISGGSINRSSCVPRLTLACLSHRAWHAVDLIDFTLIGVCFGQGEVRFYSISILGSSLGQKGRNVCWPRRTALRHRGECVHVIFFFICVPYHILCLYHILCFNVQCAFVYRCKWLLKPFSVMISINK